MAKSMFKIGDKVKIASDNDNENYDKFRGKTLIVTHVAKNTDEHRGYDDSMEGMALYDFKGVPFSLYEYELESSYAKASTIKGGKFNLEEFNDWWFDGGEETADEEYGELVTKALLKKQPSYPNEANAYSEALWELAKKDNAHKKHAKGSTVKGGENWYTTIKPNEKFYVKYDFARSSEQAKNMLRDLAEGSPIAHKSTSEGGLYNLYVKRGSIFWREKYAKGSTVGGKKYQYYILQTKDGKVNWVVPKKIATIEEIVENAKKYNINIFASNFGTWESKRENGNRYTTEIVNEDGSDFKTDKEYNEISRAIGVVKKVKYGNGGGVAVSSESGLAVGTNADLMMNQNNLQYRKGGAIPSDFHEGDREMMKSFSKKGKYQVKGWEDKKHFIDGNAVDFMRFNNLEEAEYWAESLLNENTFEWYATEVYDTEDGETMFHSEQGIYTNGNRQTNHKYAKGSTVKGGKYYQPDLSAKQWESGVLNSWDVFKSKEVAKKSFPKNDILEYSGDDIEEHTFVDNKFEIAHYKVNGVTFILYDDAMDYCDENKLPYSKIIKTKEYAKGSTVGEKEYLVKAIITDEDEMEIPISVNVFAKNKNSAMDKADDNIREQNPQWEDFPIDIESVDELKKYAKGSTVKGKDSRGEFGTFFYQILEDGIVREEKVVKGGYSKLVREMAEEEAMKFKSNAKVVIRKLGNKKYNNGGGVAVSSESGLAFGTNAELLMNEQNLQYGSGGAIKSADEGTGSSELRERAQAKINKGITVIDFQYTDYGGSFGDKVAIAYFKKHYPKNILLENSGYNGQNAFVFGKVADEYLEETKNYPLGFEDMEEFYFNMQMRMEEVEFKSFVKQLKSDGYKVSPNTFDWLIENKGGYYHIEPNMVDYSPEDLIEELIEEGLVSKKLEFGGNMSSGYNYSIGGL